MDCKISLKFLLMQPEFSFKIFRVIIEIYFLYLSKLYIFELPKQNYFNNYIIRQYQIINLYKPKKTVS